MSVERFIQKATTKYAIVTEVNKWKATEDVDEKDEFKKVSNTFNEINQKTWFANAKEIVARNKNLIAYGLVTATIAVVAYQAYFTVNPEELVSVPNQSQNTFNFNLTENKQQTRYTQAQAPNNTVLSNAIQNISNNPAFNQTQIGTYAAQNIKPASNRAQKPTSWFRIFDENTLPNFNLGYFSTAVATTTAWAISDPVDALTTLGTVAVSMLAAKYKGQ